MKRIKFLIGFLSLIAITCLFVSFKDDANNVYATDELPVATNSVSKSTIVPGETFDLIVNFDCSNVPDDYLFWTVEHQWKIYDPNDYLSVATDYTSWEFPSALSNYDMTLSHIKRSGDYKLFVMAICYPDDEVFTSVGDLTTFSMTLPDVLVSNSMTSTTLEIITEYSFLGFDQYDYDYSWDELTVSNPTIELEVKGKSTTAEIDTLTVKSTTNSSETWTANETDSSSNNDFDTVFGSGISVGAATSALTITGTAQDGGSITSVSPGSKSGSTFTVPLNGSGETTSVTVTVTAQDGTTTNTYTFDVNRAKYNIADLSGLTFSNPSGVSGNAPKLSPSFSSSTTSYTLSIPDKVSGVTQKVNMTPSINSTYKIQGVTANGSNLTTGSSNSINIDGVNSISIVITAQDGTTKTYTVTINRLSNDNTLSGDPTITILKSSGNSVLTSSDWSLSGTTYTASVDYTAVTGFSVNATANDSGATIAFNPSAKQISFDSGYTQNNKTITITVTSASGISATYNVTITRKAANEDVTFTYTVTGATTGTEYTPTKSGTQWVYTLPASEVSAKVTYSANAETTKLTGTAANTNLAFTDTYYTLTVTPEYATMAVTYQIFIKKSGSSSGGDDLSIDAYLTSLTVGDNTYTNDSADIPQSITVRVDHNVDSIYLNAIACAGATISGVGNGTSALSIGQNKITITVTAANPDFFKNYEVIVYRADDDATLTSISISNVTYTFNASNTNVSLTVPYTTSSIEVIVTKPTSAFNADVKGSGTYSLKNITMSTPLTFTVQVTSEYYRYNPSAGKTSESYTFTIYRENRITYTYLSSLSVSIGGSVVPFDSNFVKDDYVYIIENVGDNVSSVVVSATAEASTSRVTGSGTVSLPGTFEGTFPITVSVYAQSVDGDSEIKQDYIIYISRGTVNLDNQHEITGIVIKGSDGVTYFQSQFIQSTTNYTINVPYNVVSVSATATYVGSQLHGADTYTIEANSSVTITIFATNENGEQGTQYVIVVNRANAESDSTLEYIMIDGSLIEGFASSKYSYTKMLSYSTETVDIVVKATLDSSIARITIHNQIHTGIQIPLAAGADTIINVLVFAENGDNSTYTITFTRASADGALATLYIEETNFHDENGRVISYSIDRTIYYATVSYAHSNINICATSLDLEVEIRGIGIKPLSVGKQSFQVAAIPKTGNITIYEIIVIRKAEPTNTTDISSFAIKEIPNFILEFNNDVNVYESLVVPSGVKSLAFDIKFDVGEFEDAPTYKISSNDLDFGNNSVIVVVTSPDLSTTRTIVLQVERLDVEVTSVHIEQIEAFNLDYSSAITSYTYRVKSDINKLDIGLTLADALNNSYEITDTNLKNGNNTITITLKAGDEINKVIYLNVYKEASISALDIALAGSAIVVLGVCFFILRKKRKKI